MSITNVFLVLPSLPLLIILAAYLQGGSVFVLIAFIVVTGWAWGAKVLRAQAITLRERPFVQASRISGEGRWRIVLAHIVPNMLGIIVSNFFGAALFAVLAEAGLEFIGLGNINEVTWGTMLYWAQKGNAILFGSVGVPPRPRSVLLALGARPSDYSTSRWTKSRTLDSEGTDSARNGERRRCSRLRGLTVGYGWQGTPSVTAVRDVDLTVHAGEVVGVAGESGFW